jgi:hypothetical protein
LVAEADYSWPVVLTLALDHLPPVEEFEVTFHATEMCRVAALPTTSLHGALGNALRSQSQELYDTLCGGEVRDYPVPLILRFQGSSLEPTSILLHEGDPLVFRIVLIGEKAIAVQSVIGECVREAARRGLGLRHGSRDEHGSFSVGSMLRILPRTIPPMPRQAWLRVRSPLRLLEEKRLLRQLTAGNLFAAALRRLELLARHFGGGRLLSGDCPDAPFHLMDAEHRKVTFERYSTRQEKRMGWDGLVGHATLDFSVHQDAAVAWQLLTLCEPLGIGKGTSMGFGAYELEFPPLDSAPPSVVRFESAMSQPKSTIEKDAFAAATRYVREQLFREAFDKQRKQLAQSVEQLTKAAAELGLQVVPIGKVAAPSSTKKTSVKHRGSTKKTKTPRIAGLDGRILGLLRSRGEHGKAAMAKALGVKVAELTVPLRRLRKSGAVKQRGTTRAAQYTVR